MTGTQSVNDYYANPAARAAWENSDWVIFLAQKDESVELLKAEKRIHCDPGMERALKSLTTADGRYAELVLHAPTAGASRASCSIDGRSRSSPRAAPPSPPSRPSRPRGSPRFRPSTGSPRPGNRNAKNRPRKGRETPNDIETREPRRDGRDG